MPTTDPEKLKAKRARYKERHPDRRNEVSKEYYQRNRDVIREKARAAYAAMTPEEKHEFSRKSREYTREHGYKYNDAYRQRRWDNRCAEHGAPVDCAICIKPFDLSNTKAIHWDHCHNTGKFRGWLCGPCNAGIGMLQDSPEILLKAAAYLQNNPTSPTPKKFTNKML